MKKFAIAIAIATALLTIQANYSSAAVNTGDSWTPIQFSVLPGVNNWPSSNNVQGLRLGVPYCNAGEGPEANYANDNSFVRGVDLGLYSGSYNVKGLQMALLNLDASNNSGLQFSTTNVCRDSFYGLQFGAFNIYENGTGMQFGVFNSGEFTCKDFQMGLINNHNPTASGVQMGVCNTVSDYKGFQFGVLNISFESTSDSFQIGLLNFNDNGFLPCFPFVNFKK